MAVKLGVIGGGMMAQVGHLPFLFSDNSIDVCYIVENRDSLKRYIKDVYGFDRFLTSPSELILKKPDAIFLSVPRASVFPLTCQIVKAGIDLITEKPAVHSLEQALILKALLMEMKVNYFVCFMKRYDFGVQNFLKFFKKILLSGKYGALKSIEIINHNGGYVVNPPNHKRPEESSPIRYDNGDTHPSWLPQNKVRGYQWFNNAISHDINLLNLFIEEIGIPTIGKFSATDQSCEGSLNVAEIQIILNGNRNQGTEWRESFFFQFEEAQFKLKIPSPMDTNGTSLVESDVSFIDFKNKEKFDWCFSLQAQGYIRFLNNLEPPKTTIDDVIRDYQLIESLWRSCTLN